jgi:hypothetical protein
MPDPKRFSESFAATLTKLYKVGGLALVFVFIGSLTMIVAHLHGGSLSPWLFATGAVITLICLATFVYFQIKGPGRALALAHENKALLDSLQDVALESTRAVGAVQAYAFKHIEKVDQVLQALSPLLLSIPPLKKKLEELGLADARNTSKAVVDSIVGLEHLITQLEEALEQADASKFKAISQDLEALTRNLRQALAQ